MFSGKICLIIFAVIGKRPDGKRNGELKIKARESVRDDALATKKPPKKPEYKEITNTE